jgi:hypothetical protein
VSGEPVDLGHGHTLRFTSWAPDRRLNPQDADLPDVERIGAIIAHHHPDGTLCEGSIMFDGEVTRRLFPGRPLWAVESWEPLTLSPSVAAPCGDHGFVRVGRWEPA